MAEHVIITLEGVKKSYGAGSARTPVLRGVSFSVSAGEFLALVGQSGSGKSTLLNIIGGLDHADAGDITVLGHDYAKAHERELAELRNSQIGFVFQHFNLLDHLDCLGNVTVPAMFSRDGEGPGDPDARGMECLERVGLVEVARRKPSELSGGQKQRIAIARAMFNRPKLLLCDEPTGNLDTHTGRDIIEFFRELNDNDGVTLIIVTHETRVSKVAKRVIRIEDGQLVEGDEAHAWIDGDGDSSVAEAAESLPIEASTSAGSAGGEA